MQRLTTPLRIGCLNVGAYSHLPPLWAPMINPRADQPDTPLTGMRITHCWDIEPEKARAFAETFGCEAVDRFDGMLGKVDGIINGGYYNHPWNHLLHRPYIEAGLPNLINRPFTNALRKARDIIETAQRCHAPILVPSAHEHNNAIAEARAWVAGKKILCYEATNSFDDYPTHGVHGLWMVCRAVAESGNPIVSVGYRANSWHEPPGVMTIEHCADDGRIFYGTIHQVGGWGTMTLHTAEEYGGRSFAIKRGAGFPYDQTEVWAPTLWEFQRMILRHEMPQTYDQILQKTQAFLAGWRSILDMHSAAVPLAEVPDDWQSPVDLPNHPEDAVTPLFRALFGRE